MADSEKRNSPPPTETESIKLAGPDTAPTIFVDGIEGFIYDDQTVKTNLFEEVFYRVDGNQAMIQRRVAAHLVMSHRTIDLIYDWLGRQIAARNEHFAQALHATHSPQNPPSSEDAKD